MFFNKYKFIIGIGLGVIVGALVATAISRTYTAEKLINDSSVTREGGYNFINPLLSCNLSEDIPYPAFSSLLQQYKDKAIELRENGKVSRISIYFRDMNRSYWTGYHQNENYIPGSLMKVPLVLAYFHTAQKDGSIFSRKYFLPALNDDNNRETIKSSGQLAIGKSYSVEELIDATIKSSDNNAAKVLNDHVVQSELKDVFENFGIEPASDEDTPMMSPAMYMRVFRILYNASYLSKNYSQLALKKLSETTFDKGIVAGLPRGITVSHKFGERSLIALNPMKENIKVTKNLSDCGIVYYPGNPYGICIMVEGNNFTLMEESIAEVSKITYNLVSKGLLESL